MAYEIILKKRFTNKLIKVLAYLEQEWSQKVAADFLKKNRSSSPAIIQSAIYRYSIWKNKRCPGYIDNPP